MPGAINALSARLIEREGFEAMYLSGAVLANSVGGVPDVGLMTLSESTFIYWTRLERRLYGAARTKPSCWMNWT